MTGVVRVGETDIEIAPKFLNSSTGSWPAILWRILAVVEGGHVDQNLTTAHDLEKLGLPDLLAEMFLAAYSRGAARGLPRRYSSVQSVGPTLRGVFDAARVAEWLARPWEVPYTADLLTDDTALSRLLRWAAECLAATVKSPSRGRALREVASTLAHVGRRPPHLLDAQRITLGIAHQALEPAWLVGLLLLEGAGVHHADGPHVLSGFLWNSDVVYEKFIYWLCRRAAGGAGHSVHKTTVKFGEVVAGHGVPLATTPDVVFADAGRRTVAISDAKYKRLGSRPKAPDTYQVLAAAHVLGCQRVSLTYPVDRSTAPVVWRVRSSLGAAEIELTALPLDLMLLERPVGISMLVDTVSAWLGADLFGRSTVEVEGTPA